MNIQPLHPNFKVPERSTDQAGAYDVFMPEKGSLTHGNEKGEMIPLGFAAEVPLGYVALLLPRSGAGAKQGIALNNTIGVIDSDYRGEWMACLRKHDTGYSEWEAGDRLLQFLLVPVGMVNFNIVEELSTTERGVGGFGHTGN